MMEGFRAAPDKVLAFEALARQLVIQKKYKELAKLIQEHATTNAGDPWLQLYSGELNLERGESAQADECLTALLVRSAETDRWYLQCRFDMLRARIKTDNAAATYQELGPGSRTFRQLANACISEKSADQLQALIAVHRQAHPHAGDWAMWDLEVLWLKKDYAGVLKLLKNDQQEQWKWPPFKWKADSFLVRSLLYLKRPDEALQVAENSAKNKMSDRALLVLVHASRGDVKRTLEVITRLGLRRFTVEEFYRDPDLGPILRSAAFGEFRERFPEPPPYDDTFGNNFDGG